MIAVEKSRKVAECRALMEVRRLTRPALTKPDISPHTWSPRSYEWVTLFEPEEQLRWCCACVMLCDFVLCVMLCFVWCCCALCDDVVLCVMLLCFVWCCCVLCVVVWYCTLCDVVVFCVMLCFVWCRCALYVVVFYEMLCFVRCCVLWDVVFCEMLLCFMRCCVLWDVVVFYEMLCFVRCCCVLWGGWQTSAHACSLHTLAVHTNIPLLCLCILCSLGLISNKIHYNLHFNSFFQFPLGLCLDRWQSEGVRGPSSSLWSQRCV